MEERLRGTVRWFNPVEGYGFIGRPDGDDVFFHRSALRTNGDGHLQPGQPVEFRLEAGPKGLQAVEVIPL